MHVARKKNLNILIIMIAFNSCTLAGKKLGNLGFFSYLFRIKPQPVECFTYAKTVNYTSSAGANNSYKCNYSPESISMECIYTNAITEDNITTITKTDFYNSSEDFILKTKNFAQSTVRYSQLNKDITTNKFFQYDPSGKLTSIIQSDGTLVTVSEYDAKNRNTKGIVNLSNFDCQFPFTSSYDDINLSFKQNFFFSQLSPSTNLHCYFFSTAVPDQTLEFFFDTNFFPTKKILTSGSTVTTEIFTTTESAQLCTGSNGTPYSAPIIQKINSTGGAVGETVSLIGINFDTDPIANTIQFANGIKTFGSSATNSTLSFIVPAGATSGQIKVTNRFGTALSKNIFYVYKYFVYVGNNSSASIFGADFDITNGNLVNSFVLNSVGTNPRGLMAHPNGKFLYLALQGTSTINVYNINQSTGALTLGGTGTAGTAPRTLVIDSTGNFLFVLNTTPLSISRFSINQTTGILTFLGSTTYTGTNPYWMAANPHFPFLYITDSSGPAIYSYSIDSTGNLTNLSGSPTSISASPAGITISPSGLYLYTANNSGTNSVSRLLINQLSGIISSEAFVGTTYGMESVAVDPTGKYAFACSNGTGMLNAYQINQTNGALVSMNSLSSPNCRTVIVDPSGKYVITTEDVAGGLGRVNKFSIGSDGSITSIGGANLSSNNPQPITFAKVPQ